MPGNNIIPFEEFIIQLHHDNLTYVQTACEIEESFVHTVNPNGWNLCHIAVEHGALNVVKWLVEEQDIDITARTNCGRTLLLIAAENGNTRLVEFFLKKDELRVTIDEVDDYRRTPLMHAARKGRLPMAKLLVEAGAAINLKDGLERTALIHASKFGHKAVVDFLVKAGNADLLEKEKNGKTGFVYAAEAGQLATVEWFLENTPEAKQPEQISKALDSAMVKCGQQIAGSQAHVDYFNLGKFLYFALKRQQPKSQPACLTAPQMTAFDAMKREQVTAYANQIKDLVSYYNTPAINSIIGTYLNENFTVCLNEQERKKIASYLTLRAKLDDLGLFDDVPNVVQEGIIPSHQELAFLKDILMQVKTNKAVTMHIEEEEKSVAPRR